MRPLLVLLVLLAGCGGRGKTVQPSAPDSVASGGDASGSPGFVQITFDDDELDDAEMGMLLSQTAECGDLIALEPQAMLGKLDQPSIGCLEDKLLEADKQTFKKKISLLLMVDAWSKKETHRWETIVRRHLEEIDRSDPDLCYKFASHLAKEGASKGEETIYWSEVALENKTRWSGDTYVARVYALLKLRATAQNAIWQDLDAKFAASPADEGLRAQRDQARNQTKTLAREWLEFARKSGKDDTVAYQLCTSAAGTAEYCDEI